MTYHLHCDKCGKETEPGQSTALSIIANNLPDGEGNCDSRIWRRDYCFECAMVAVSAVENVVKSEA